MALKATGRKAGLCKEPFPAEGRQWEPCVTLSERGDGREHLPELGVLVSSRATERLSTRWNPSSEQNWNLC